MDRRSFIETTSLTAAGVVAGSAGHAAAASSAVKSKPAVPAILATFDAETHRR